MSLLMKLIMILMMMMKKMNPMRNLLKAKKDNDESNE